MIQNSFISQYNQESYRNSQSTTTSEKSHTVPRGLRAENPESPDNSMVPEISPYRELRMLTQSQLNHFA